jgi:methylisocitrate lyase
MRNYSKEFRKILQKPGLVVRPAVYDALSAVVAEKVGFPLLGTTGYGIAASLIGKPDVGLVSFGEMLNHVRGICHAVNVPVSADVDTGYGNAVNAYWTTKNFIWSGASGLQMEDQVWPKRCGHMVGKQIISKEEMAGKIRACVKARNEENPEFVITARTDARSVAGLEEAIERGKTYAKAGADCIYVEAPQSLQEVQSLLKSIPAPLAFNIIEGGRTPPYELEELESIGVKIVSFPLTCMYAATRAMLDVFTTLKETRDYRQYAEKVVSWNDFNDLIGLQEMRKLEIEFTPRQSLETIYGTSNMQEIVEKEKNQTARKWSSNHQRKKAAR